MNEKNSYNHYPNLALTNIMAAVRFDYMWGCWRAAGGSRGAAGVPPPEAEFFVTISILAVNNSIKNFMEKEHRLRSSRALEAPQIISIGNSIEESIDFGLPELKKFHSSCLLRNLLRKASI